MNGNTYYPEVHQWALEKKLTIICNSDIHGLIDFEYDSEEGEHRPITLVFAKDKSRAALKQALFNRRTVAYYKNILIGEQRFLRPLFNASIKILNPDVVLQRDHSASIQLHNSSDIDYKLNAISGQEEYSISEMITLPAHKTVMLKIKKNSKIRIGENIFRVLYDVSNLLVAPNKGLPIELKFSVFSEQGIRIVPINNDEYKFSIEDENQKFKIFYTIDGSDPTQKSIPWTEPFRGQDSLLLKYCVFKNGRKIGNIIERRLKFHQALGRKLTLKHEFSPKYAAGGGAALIDGVTGTLNYQDGYWQGFEQDDFEATIDLKQIIPVQRISANFLQDTGVWIFFPKVIEFAVSEDGKDFQVVFHQTFDLPNKKSKKMIKNVFIKFQETKVRYIRVLAKNIGLCPYWHQGAGGKAWIFIDEIVVE